MSNWNTVQSKFTQGELSPLWLGESNSDLVHEGCQTILNGVVLPQGPVTTRPGTNWLSSFSDAPIRLWTFIGAGNEDFIAIFHDDQVWVADLETGVIDGSNNPFIQLIQNGDFNDLLVNWTKVTPSAAEYLTYVDISSEFEGLKALLTISLLASTYPGLPMTPVVKMYQETQTTITVNEAVVQLNAFIAPVDLSFNPVNVDQDWTGFCRIELGSTPEGQEHGVIDHELIYLADRVLTLNLTGLNIPPNTPIYLTLSFYCQAIDDPAIGTYRMRAYYDDVQLNVRSTVPPSPINFTTPYVEQTDLNELHFVQSPFRDGVDNFQELIILHPNYPPQALFYNQQTLTWGFGDYFDPMVDSLPPEWDEGGNGQWPSIGVGAQGRLWLSGLTTNPETIWASEQYNWKNYAPGTADNEPLVLVGIERDINTWLAANKNILYGDRRKELTIRSAGAAVTPTDVALDVNTSFGTERMPQKINMGKNVVLPTGGNNDLRLCYYNRNDNGYIAPNILLKAEHLGNPGFTRCFYTRDPHQILWNVMGDGQMILCSFDDEYNIQAWSRFACFGPAGTIDGSILDGCSAVDTNGRNVVALAVRREVDGVEQINIETITNLGNPDNWDIVDSKVTVFPVMTEAGQVGGFDELIGFSVAVFLDGQFDGFQVVDTNGEIFASQVSSRIDCGIGYRFEVETFPAASMTAQSGLSSKKRYSRVGIRGVFTLPPLIDGQRPPDRSPQAVMNNSEPVPRVIDTEVVDGTTDEFGTILVQEELPIRLTIAAIYGKLASNQV